MKDMVDDEERLERTSWKDRPLSMTEALEWAFWREGARVDFDTDEPEATGFGKTHTIIQREKLGVRIDNSRKLSTAHVDAETIAMAVSNLPREFGGRSMALRIAEVARSGVRPDWMPGAVAKCEPREWRRLPNGQRVGRREVVGKAIVITQTPHPKNSRRLITRKKRVDVYATPITWVLHPDTIESARDEYHAWWLAVLYLASQLTRETLFELRINADLPPRMPWALTEVR